MMLQSLNLCRSSRLFVLLLLSSIVASDEPENGSINDHYKGRQVKGVMELTIPIRTHAIWSPYVDTDLQNRWYDFGGSTILDTSQHVRLTQDRPSQAGYLWSRYPITQSSFQITMEFKIDGQSASLYGDGMAMWLSKNPQQVGPVFGSTDMWDGIGIFIDTFPNGRHSYAFPRILGMVNHGYTSYDVGTDGEGQESGACSYPVRRAEVATMLQVNYVRGQFLELLVQHDKWDQWHHCFTVWNYTLPDNPYLGFTAHTGEVSDAHDVISIATNGLAYHPPPKVGEKAHVAPEPSWLHTPGGGIGSGGLGFWGRMLAYMTWVVKWGVILSCVGAALFWSNKYFSKYQKESQKRF